MSRPTFIISTIFLLLSSIPRTAAAQQVNEKEVNLQQTFIDATREKILGNYEEAAALFEQVLKEDDRNDAAAYELGRIYDALDNQEKALKYLKTAADLDPANEWYKQLLADTYQKNGRYAEAAALYEDLVGQQPDNDQYYFQWAYFLVKASDIKKAIRVYDQLESRIGINEEVIRRKHSLYLGSGDHKRAAREIERLIEAYPDNTEYRHLLAGFYEQVGDDEQARAVYRQILQIDPEDAKANLALAGAQNTRGNQELAFLESLKPIFANPEVDIDLKISQLFPFITKVADTGDRNLAQAALELTALLERAHPGEAKAFSASGDLLYHSGRTAEALEKYKNTLELDETVFSVWEQIMFIYLETGDYDNLARTAENAMDLFPNKAVIYYMNGVAQDELGHHEDALDLLDQALLMAGNNPRLKFDTYIRQGQVHYTVEEYEAAFRAFDQALELNPRDPVLLNNYSYYLAVQNYHLDKAREMAAAANDIVKDNATFQDTYGWVLYKLKDYKNARKWLDKALENQGDQDPDILEHYGDLLFQLNEPDQAIEYWKKAQQKGSGSPLLEKKINDRKLYEQ